MSAFKARDLRVAAASHSTSLSVRNNIKSIPSLARKRVFLSHSHLDKDLVKGLIVQLSQLGVALYVDWLDAAMPDSPNKETVERIKQKIGENDLFMMLASRNALNSKWVPWELGVADQKKGYERIFIARVEEEDGFVGNEYVRVYQKLEPNTAGQVIVQRPTELFGRPAASVLG